MEISICVRNDTVVMLLSAYFYSRRRYVVSVLLILAVCAINLLLNFRSPVLGLLLLIVLVFPIIPERVIGMRIVPQSQQSAGPSRVSRLCRC